MEVLSLTPNSEFYRWRELRTVCAECFCKEVHHWGAGEYLKPDVPGRRKMVEPLRPTPISDYYCMSGLCYVWQGWVLQAPQVYDNVIL